MRLYTQNAEVYIGPRWRLKAEVTRQAKAYGLIPAPPLWQRNFWDRIVRDEQELVTVRDYIATNSARWLADQLHPKAAPNPFMPLQDH